MLKNLNLVIKESLIDQIIQKQETAINEFLKEIFENNHDLNQLEQISNRSMNDELGLKMFLAQKLQQTLNIATLENVKLFNNRVNHYWKMTFSI